MIQLVFAAGAAAVILAMKAAGLARSRRPVAGPPPDASPLFWLAPVPSRRTWGRRRPVDAAGLRAVLRRLLGWGAVTALAYGLYWRWVPALQPPGPLLAYLALPPAFVSGLAGGALAELALLPLGVLLPPLHGPGVFAPSLDAFWGRGWNRWMSDGFRELVFDAQRRAPERALLLAFGVSGLLHEGVINGPAQLVTGAAPWGTVLLFFGVQWAGTRGERYVRPAGPLARRLYALAVLIVPAPLLLAEPLLRILFLWPG